MNTCDFLLDKSSLEMVPLSQGNLFAKHVVRSDGCWGPVPTALLRTVLYLSSVASASAVQEDLAPHSTVHLFLPMPRLRFRHSRQVFHQVCHPCSRVCIQQVPHPVNRIHYLLVYHPESLVYYLLRSPLSDLQTHQQICPHGNLLCCHPANRQSSPVVNL